VGYVKDFKTQKLLVKDDYRTLRLTTSVIKANIAAGMVIPQKRAEDDKQCLQKKSKSALYCKKDRQHKEDVVRNGF
jgi:hypothetical protein